MTERRNCLVDSQFWVPIEEIKRLDQLKADLTLHPRKSPAMQDAKEPLVLWTENTANGMIGVPRAFGFEHFGHLPMTRSVADGKSLKGTPLEIKHNIQWRPGQEEFVQTAVAEILNNGYGGVMRADGGFGKTVCSIGVMAALGVPVLFMVHKDFLMDQLESRMLEHTGMRIGRVQQGVCQYKNFAVTAGMMQSLAQRDYGEEFYNHFGAVFVDEVHRAGAPSYLQAINKLPAKYRVGITATPRRGDGLQDAFFWTLGKIVSVGVGKMLTCKVFRVRIKLGIPTSRYMINGRPIPARALNCIAKHQGYSQWLADEILKAHGAGRKILALSDRIEQIDEVMRLLEQKLTIGAVAKFVGDSDEKERKQADKKQIILSTYPMAREGLDIPPLDTLVMMTPISDCEQAVARIQRQYVGKKEPLVIDCCPDLPYFQEREGNRLRFYNLQRFDVSEIGFGGI